MNREMPGNRLAIGGDEISTMGRSSLERPSSFPEKMVAPPSMGGADLRLGEIVAVSTSEFTAQSYQLEVVPSFGSLVRVGKPDGPRHFGICYTASTGSIEPSRTAMAWGRDEESDADIFRHQPQLAHVLQTTWTCLLVGDARGPAHLPPVQRIPPTPPRLHSFVYAASEDEVRLFHRDMGYLRFLLRSGAPNIDDLIAACLAHAYASHQRDQALLLQAGRTLARLLARDHDRLMAILTLLDATLVTHDNNEDLW